MSFIIKGIDLPKGKDEALLLLILGDGTVAEQISTNRYEEITDAEAIQKGETMTNADKFKETFDIYATELWAMPEADFLKWWNADYKTAVEPKTGEWVRITKGLTFEKYACSICGRQIEDEGSGELLLVKYPYCHCGAKMERSKE